MRRRRASQEEEIRNDETKVQQEKKGKIRLPGLLIALIMLAESAVIFYFIWNLKLLPNNYLTFIGVGLIVVTLIVYALASNFRNRIRFALGTILCLCMTVICVMGVSYARKADSFYKQISETTKHITDVGVYATADSEITSIESLTKDDTIGILGNLDRDVTDAALSKLEETTGKEFQVKEYDDAVQGIAGLEKKETSVFMCNDAFFELVRDAEGNEDIDDRVVKVDVLSVETEEEEKNAGEDQTSEQAKATIKTEEEDITKKPFKVFISGIDTRGEMTAKSRSDVNIIATINPETKQILLVSTPRDYFVPLSISDGVPDKLTHAGIYGIDVCVDTMEMLYDTDMDYYFRINFGGFVKVIDALGGITIQSDYDFNSGNVKGYHFDKGANEVDGEAALVFARERYAFADGDRQRGRNQMAVIQGVANKVMSKDILKNFSEILEEVGGCFETDIPYDTLAMLVKGQLDSGGDWKVLSYSVSGEGTRKKPYSMNQSVYVMIPDESTIEEAKSLMQDIEDGKVMTQDEIIQPAEQAH